MEKKISALVKSARDLAALIKLEQDARRCKSLEEVYQFIVNRTREMVPYDFATLYINDVEQFVSFSDVSMEDFRVPVVEALEGIESKYSSQTVEEIKYSKLNKHLQKLASEYLFSHTLRIPLVVNQEQIGVLYISRSVAFLKRELVLLDHLRECYAHAIKALVPVLLKPQMKQRIVHALKEKRFHAIMLVVCITLLVAVRVNLTVLAPAEVVAREPQLVKSPVDGVVDQIFVEPNQDVQVGDLLFTLDQTNLDSKREVASKQLEVALAELVVAKKTALTDLKQKQRLPAIKAEVKKYQAELEYLEYILSETAFSAQKNGVVIYDHKHKLEGKPVQTGETVMQLSDPKDSALDVFLPVADAINFAPGAKVELYLNAKPNSPVIGYVQYAAYKANLTPEKTLAYHVRVLFSEQYEVLPRIGLHGSAKIYGEKVSLFYYLFRRPMAYIRKTLGV